MTETGGAGYDTVAATVNYLLPANVEALYMIGADLTGIGSGNADSLLSSGGPNTLVGLGGDDLYYVNNPDDVVTEAANGGFDTVMASVSYTLPANVEAMYMIGSGLTGTGTSGADTLVTLGANTLVGDDGNDMFVLLRRQRQRRDRCRLRWPKRGGCPGVQRLRHRGASRDLHARSADRPMAAPFRPRFPQRDHHARERRRAGYRGFLLRVRRARPGVTPTP